MTNNYYTKNKWNQEIGLKLKTLFEEYHDITLSHITFLEKRDDEIEK